MQFSGLFFCEFFLLQSQVGGNYFISSLFVYFFSCDRFYLRLNNTRVYVLACIVYC